MRSLAAGTILVGLVTVAAALTLLPALLVAVFVGFAAGELVTFQQMGFGVAVALLIDATIVRSVLVPAGMALLGSWNWYLPRRLGWLPRVEIKGSHAGGRPPRALLDPDLVGPPGPPVRGSPRCSS
jgi:hypothetical protein